MSYENVGNIKNYKHSSRIVKPEGLIETPNLVTKIYTMLPEGISVNLDFAKKFIKTKIKEREIIPYLSGMGFTILSPEFLNITIWGEEFPIVSKNEVYSFEKEDLSDSRRLDLNNKGAYCSFEGTIFGHESLLWIKYLKSSMKEKDKQDYFNSFLETILE